MHLSSIPRHQIETQLADYADMASALLSPARSRSAVREFEQAFARHIGCQHAIAVSSGRLGLHLILEALDPLPGDEAIIPAFNLFAVIERFCQLGIRPRFCDIRSDDLNIDSIEIKQNLTANSRFLLATHMFGHAADMDRLESIARHHRLVLIEDCAHALGSRYNGRMVGTFGRAAIFSFSVLKLVTTFGGGMIATNDDELASRIRSRLICGPAGCSFRTAAKRFVTGAAMDWGTRKAVFSLASWPVLRAMHLVRTDWQQQIMTETPRLDRQFSPASVEPLHPFQARLGLNQLQRVEELIERRRQVGRWFDECLSPIEELRVLHSFAASRHNGLYYGVLADNAAELAAYLFRRGIDCETSEYRNCAELEIYREIASVCPVAQRVASRILRLPNYPSLSRRDVQRIADAISEFYDFRRSYAESKVSTCRHALSASA